MQNEVSIEHFLRYGFGYEKLAHFVTGHKPEEISLRKYLEGTVIGTIRTHSVSSIPYNQPQQREQWKSPYKKVPGIDEISRLEDFLEKAYWSKKIEKEEVKKFPHFIASGVVFNNLTAKQVNAMLEEHIKKAFPEQRCNYTCRGSFSVSFNTENFMLKAGGVSNRSSPKYIIIGLNASKDLFDWVNNIVASYYAIMHSIVERDKKSDI